MANPVAIGPRPDPTPDLRDLARIDNSEAVAKWRANGEVGEQPLEWIEIRFDAARATPEVMLAFVRAYQTHELLAVDTLLRELLTADDYDLLVRSMWSVEHLVDVGRHLVGVVWPY